MLIIISVLLPIIAGIIVYRMFREDLQHTQSIRKLKRGAVEALIERHQRALKIHSFVYFAVVVIYFLLFGIQGLILTIFWLIVYMGHTQALSRLSKRMMGGIEVGRMMDARLADAPLENDMHDIDYDYNEEKATLGD